MVAADTPYMTAIDRNLVYWFGLEPSAAERAEFAQRNLRVELVKDGATPDFNLARAAVFCAKPPFVPSACGKLDVVTTALNHGLLVYLLAEDDTTQAHLRSQVPAAAWSGPLAPHLRARTGEMPPFECAEVIARHQAGPRAKSTLDIHLPPGVELSPERLFMIRRAFSDCSTVSLEPLSGGRSAAAYAVQARLVASAVGPRPLPFFMKLDSPEKIVAEEARYRDYATLHIPWYLRPNLDPARCLVGLEQGVLVGSFVGQSESLWEAVLDGRGPRYIHALFEETLMGWRSQAYQHPPRKGRLARTLRDTFKWEKVKQEHVDRASEFGEVQSPRHLWEALLNVPEQTWREAPMHGDMHAENVRVRNDDAIIIDLAKAGMGPLCADIASLEVWLSFEVPSEPKKIPNREDWTVIVREMYSPQNVARPPNLATTDVGTDWLRACARQTRMFGGAICECNTEYATAIAVHLLRRACYSRDEGDALYLAEDAYRRALAYQLGSSLVDWLATATVTEAA